MKNRIFAILSVFCLLISGCGKIQTNGVPQNFKPVSMSLDGEYSAVFNEDYAVAFKKTILDTMQPAKTQKVESRYRFTLMEQPGEARREYQCTVSPSQKLLKSDAGCYRLTDEAVTFLSELTDSSLWITAGEEYTLTEDTYMVISAVYEDFFLAVLSEDPTVTVKVNLLRPDSFYKTVGDKVTGSFYDTKKEGNRIETLGASLMTAEEKENIEHIVV